MARPEKPSNAKRRLCGCRFGLRTLLADPSELVHDCPDHTVARIGIPSATADAVPTPRAMQQLARVVRGGDARTIRTLLTAGRLVLVRRKWEYRADGAFEPTTPIVPAVLAAVPNKTSWIKFKVVHNQTNDPVVGVRLKITTPSKTVRDYQTRADGMIDVQGIDMGACDVTCDLTEALLAETLAFKGMGTTPIDVEPPPEGAERPSASIEDEPLEAQWIATVERHKVKTGETLEQVAAQYGTTVPELARFNWGTDDPYEINDCLHDYVGSWKKDRDGRSFLLDSMDDPGLIFVPRQWSLAGLPTEQTHVLRVTDPAGYRLILENDYGLRIPEAHYRVRLADGSVREGQLGRAGMTMIEDPPPGVVEVEYTDLDDVEAKSLAACARQAFDERNLEEIFRVLKHSGEMVKRAIAAYDQYYNDYTGNGLLGDIDFEFSDPLVRPPIDALLRIAEIKEFTDVYPDSELMA